MLQSSVLLIVMLVGTVGCDYEPKWYNVDLDGPAKERWNHILQVKRSVVDKINQEVSEKIPAFIRPYVEKLAGDLEYYIHEPFASEIKGVAKFLNVSVGQVVISNILYDVTAACTSIVAEDSKGQIWLARNLDYSFTTLLKEATVGVHFTRNGEILYSGTTYAGYVGLLTGQRPHAFAISLDERNSGALWMNILIALLDRKATLFSFMIRETLAEEDNFKAAIKRMSSTPTIASAYLIIGGVERGEGAVITKGRLWSVDTWYLDTEHGRWYLVETNYDHWEAPPASDDRRTPAQRSMNATGPDNIGVNTLYRILSIPPVLDSTTTYTSVMSAAEPELYRNWVRGQPPQP